MKCLEFGDELVAVIENKTPVFSIIEHKLSNTFHIRKGRICGAGCGENGRCVIFKEMESKIQDEWYLPIDRCFINNDNKKEIDKNQNIDLNLFEILDRSHCLQCHFEDDILEHQALERYPDLKKAASEVSSALMNLYQMVSGKFHN